MTATRDHRVDPDPTAPARGAGPLAWAPWAFTGAGILAQIAFPLTGGGTFALTVAAVVLLAGASLSHVLLTHGPGAALALLVVVGGGAFAAEAVGVHTGLPFGAYDYTGSLGAEALGVPLLVPLAWVMMAWPALVAARHLVGDRVARLPAPLAAALTAAVAAVALTAWDVFLDPQMVAAGHWRWADPTPALPGSPGIPLTNYAGWLLVSFLVCVVLARLVGTDRGGHSTAPGRARDAVPLTVYLWTYASSVLANAVFFGRPWVALLGAGAMGVVAIPLAVGLLRARAAGAGRGPTRRRR